MHRLSLFCILLVSFVLQSTDGQQSCFKVTTCNENEQQSGSSLPSSQGPPGKIGPRGPRGERGVPGIKGNQGQGVESFIARIETLERDLAEMKSQMIIHNASLEETMEKIENLTERNPIYSIFKTSTSGSFSEMREKCREEGGDIVRETLKKTNFRWREHLNTMKSMISGRTWIGYSDASMEGVWKIVDEEAIHQTIFEWFSNQPDGEESQNYACVEINSDTNTPQIRDLPKSENYPGLCERLQ